ncbi:MAG: tail fiber domain-containing protein, partial [Candidatus Fonsibacter sp.]
CGSGNGQVYIDFTTLSTNTYYWTVHGVPINMTLNATGLTVVGTITPGSDNRLNFNKTPLTNSLDVINRLEPVEYDQTYNLVDEYTPETPQSHQSGFIAQSVQNIDELKYTVIGG